LGGGAALLMLAAAIVLMAGRRDGGGNTYDGPLFQAKRGPLLVKVAVSGDIRSEQARLLESEVEGNATIISIIDEGTRVEEGDVLIEMDTSDLRDERRQAKLELQNAEAAHTNAEQNLQIVKREGEANIRAAKVDLNLARLDLEKYLGALPSELDNGSDYMQKIAQLNDIALDASTLDTGQSYDRRMQAILDELDGEYKQNAQEALNSIRITRTELTRAEETLASSERLEEKGFITERELEADQLEVTRLESELQQARGELRLLRAFTYPRTVEEYRSTIDQREFDLEKARHDMESDVIDARANLTARKEELAGERDHLEEINEQIEASTIRAPTNGVLLYAERDDDDPPLDTGVQVHQREDLLRLPTADDLIAEVKIHESMVEKVREGMPVRITTDAVANATFEGTLEHVAIMPDNQSNWLNPDRKVYNARVKVETGVERLRPGMSCNVEIIVAEFDDVVYVPLQAVIRVGGESRVYLPGPDGPEPRTVQVGLDNDRMVRVTDGLAEGESVLLAPPIPEHGQGLAAAQREEAQQELQQQQEQREEQENGGGQGRGEAGGRGSRG